MEVDNPHVWYSENSWSSEQKGPFPIHVPMMVSGSAYVPSFFIHVAVGVVYQQLMVGACGARFQERLAKIHAALLQKWICCRLLLRLGKATWRILSYPFQ